MSATHSTFRTTAALVLLAVAVGITLSLGRWQLDRADQRRALSASIQSAREMAPLDLGVDTPSAQLTAWRSARAQGTWLPERSVMLENRNHQGRPGYWVATPLRLSADPSHVVLVLRGWMPRSLSDTRHPALPDVAAGQQSVQGEIALHVPRLFELGGGQYSRLPERIDVKQGQAAPVVQNLDLGDYARASGLQVLPVVLQQIRPDDDGLVHDWPQPSLDYNQNQGYAFQWFAFAAIAGIAWVVVAWRAWQRTRRRARERAVSPTRPPGS